MKRMRVSFLGLCVCMVLDMTASFRNSIQITRNNRNIFEDKEVSDYMRFLDSVQKSKRGTTRGFRYLDLLQHQNRKRPVDSTPSEKRSVFVQRMIENQARETAKNISRTTAWTIFVQSDHDLADEEEDEVDPSELRRKHSDIQKKASPTGAFSIQNTVDFNFTMIGGYDEVKAELTQVMDFMKFPEKYQPYNVRLPRGVLMYGEPGTGKTLLAKCLAGECGLSFIPTSGSEFQEKYVGVGSARIRELFQYARDNNPCIIFIDEIDSVARRRNGDGENAQAERDSTLNQLLVEMDGFRENRGVMVLASTNRHDILDPALLRPGRIDKQVHVSNPNYNARLEICRIHIRGKPISVSPEVIAGLTAGWTGAQIENLLNEVSLYGIRTNSLPVNQSVIETYHDIQTVGGKAMAPLNLSMGSLWRISVHEMGHVLIAFHSDHHEKPIKCTISSPNGNMAGYTTFGKTSSDSRKEDDNVLPTREYMMDRMRILLGGRVAEEVVFGMSVSGGAKQDLEMCFHLARRMVSEFGMGKQIVYSPLSDHSRRMMDEDITNMIDTAYQDAKFFLQKNSGLLRFMSRHLLKQKTLKQDDLTRLIMEYAGAKEHAS